MIYLIIVSLIWAFSFGLIKTNLTSIDSNFVAFFRMGLSFLAFLPFLKLKNISKNDYIIFPVIGAVQYGIMYLAYIYAYQFLKAYEIALFTIFTPLYITIFNDFLEKKFNKIFLLTSVMAVIGAAIIKYDNIGTNEFLFGFILVQVSNVCFAIGQILYVKRIKIKKVSNISIFALLYFGALIITFTASLFSTDYTTILISNEQLLTIIYLGIVASGIAFFLWNLGATKVNEGTLAVFNNLKIPLGIIVSLLFFGEQTDLIRLTIGCIIMGIALYINENR